MTLQQTLSDIITSLPDWSTRQLNEAQTSQAIVLRVLQALGYDIWNPFEVIPEETADSGRKPDYIVSTESTDKPRFVVEVKRLGRDLDTRAKIQAVNYANNKAIRWAVLTDGASWLLFDSFMHAQKAQDRLVLTLSLRKQSVQVLANALGRLLHVDVWSRDDVHTYIDQTARDIRDNLRLSAQLEPLAETLRRFMDEMTIREPEKGIELARGLGKWSEEEQKLIEENKALFLSLIGKVLPPPEPKFAEVLRKGIGYAIDAVPDVKETSGLEVFVDDEPIAVRNWRDILAGAVETSLLLGKIDVQNEHAKIYNSTDEYRKKNGERYPKSAFRRLGGDRYIYANYSADKSAREIGNFLQALGAPNGIIEVNYRDKRYEIP